MSSWSSRGQMRTFSRMARVNELLREIVAEEVERIPDFDEIAGIVTVTGVEVSADLDHATVYVSLLSDEVLEVFEAARSDIQHAISRQAKLKRTPRLAFQADPAIEEGEKVESVLRRIRSVDGYTR
ncbi:MAG: 30S ribosome-binding factor RbfA [Actinobacteria bacterium]|nr:30S ribosome-binding factor RbfA [Actinomycetota bacterium]